MLIGIDASRAFLKRRTGIEEYSYQVIKHLRDVVPKEYRVVLYVRKKIALSSVVPSLSRNLISIFSRSFGFAQDDMQKIFPFFRTPGIDFELPENWEVRGLWAPRFWTQIRLSLEMLFYPPDVLFVPAHTVPIIHPRRTIVTVHGLEYEFCPRAYSLWQRLYMRTSIRFSVRAAETVIAVSENTKRDLVRWYGIAAEKIRVVYEGYERIKNQESLPVRQVGRIKNQNQKPYLLFIGRLEERKNLKRIVRAFEILKRQHNIPHDLVLVGKPGFGYEKIRSSILNSQFSIHIKEVGYVDEEEKWELLQNADIFLFPTLYEGFGIPVLEAQSVGVPVVTSNVSSLPEVGGEGAIYVDPKNAESVAEGVQKLLSNQDLRSGIIAKGRENMKRFSWEKCSQEVTDLFNERHGTSGQ